MKIIGVMKSNLLQRDVISHFFPIYKNRIKDNARTFWYVIDFDDVTLETKSIVVQYTIVITQARTFARCVHIVVPSTGYFYFYEDTAYAVLFRALFSINSLNLIKILTAVFERVATLPFRGLSEGLLFLELECSYSPSADL
jgi:hypothetical protein